jgi:hypothetical protein
LYSLGSGGNGHERDRIQLNVSRGSVPQYTSRVIKLLASLLATYVKWPKPGERAGRGVFKDCIGFIDGSEIPLRWKPMKDWETFFQEEDLWFQSSG